MKALVCGNAPCLPKQLIGRDLSEFDIVVRMNGWREIEGADNRCDAWSCWPFQTRLPTNLLYWDVKEYARNTKELWYAHPNHSQEKAEVCYGRKIDYAFPLDEALKQIKEVGSAPEMGMLMIRMAQLLTENVYVAGFDHYQDPESDYYFPGGQGVKLVHPAHNHANDRIWFEKQKLSSLHYSST